MTSIEPISTEKVTDLVMADFFFFSSSLSSPYSSSAPSATDSSDGMNLQILSSFHHYLTSLSLS